MKLKQWLAHGWFEGKKKKSRKKPTYTSGSEVAAKKMVVVVSAAIGDSGSGLIASSFSFSQLRHPKVTLSLSLSGVSALGYLVILTFTREATQSPSTRAFKNQIKTHNQFFGKKKHTHKTTRTEHNFLKFKANPFEKYSQIKT